MAGQEYACKFEQFLTKVAFFLTFKRYKTFEDLTLTSPSSWLVTLPPVVPFCLVRSPRLLASLNWIKNLVWPCRWFWQHLKTIFTARKFARSFFLQSGKSARSLFWQENCTRSNFFRQKLARSFFSQTPSGPPFSWTFAVFDVEEGGTVSLPYHDQSCWVKGRRSLGW